jgi:two-component system, OmpR family, response regulator AdeR
VKNKKHETCVPCLLNLLKYFLFWNITVHMIKHKNELMHTAAAHKILIVEDDEAIRNLYDLKFQKEGFATSTAENGRHGLRKAEDFMPDLILLDLRMPVMSGDEMLLKLRESNWGSNMRVIVLTNISKSEAPHSLRFLHVDRYVVKVHNTPSQIVDMVKEVLA